MNCYFKPISPVIPKNKHLKPKNKPFRSLPEPFAAKTVSMKDGSITPVKFKNSDERSCEPTAGRMSQCFEAQV